MYSLYARWFLYGFVKIPCHFHDKIPYTLNTCKFTHLNHYLYKCFKICFQGKTIVFKNVLNYYIYLQFHKHFWGVAPCASLQLTLTLPDKKFKYILIF